MVTVNNTLAAVLICSTFSMLNSLRILVYTVNEYSHADLHETHNAIGPHNANDFNDPC